ncbi:MAG: hypothetical protein F6K26_25325 [Moorea sp. SIO2I5]|nr:hypothetical protein [Moorena sp. SIO2I5]
MTYSRSQFGIEICYITYYRLKLPIIAFIIAMRYTLFFPSSLFPAPCSLLPKT